jgi:DNA invertase Pin-like site-specific DNA recombinase
MSEKKAFAYLRVSSRGQASGHGFDRQEEAIRAFARKERIEITEVFRDAHTGTEADRPAFVGMLAAILSNGVRTIIVESLDRLARDIVVQTGLLGELRRRGVALIAANTGEEVTAADDPMREALISIQGVFAQLDKKLLVRKLRLAREAKRKTEGRCEGVRPFGSLPGEEAIKRRILSLRRGRGALSFAKIAARLNAEKIRTRSGGQWAPGIVFGIVKGNARRRAVRQRAANLITKSANMRRNS